MVQIIENWSDISGMVRSYSPSSGVEGFAAVVVQVEKVSDVPGFANLLGQTTGTDLTILIPQALAARLKLMSGMGIECRVRRGGIDRIFVHPDHISVSEPNMPDHH